MEVQYLGFRYHGWQIQGKLKTLQLMIGKTINFIWPHTWKILVAGRTDAMVSANSSYFELFTKEPIDISDFQSKMNANLPADISIRSIKEVDKHFNVIQDVKQKTYQYFFYYGQDKYPLSASLLSYFNEELDLNAMKEAALLFKGAHYFHEFSKDVSEKSQVIRTISDAAIINNDQLTASFFPPQSFVFQVTGKGFARHQIRLMMGGLVQIGRGELSIDILKQSLEGEKTALQKFLAPASGLMVKEMQFNDLG